MADEKNEKDTKPAESSRPADVVAMTSRKADGSVDQTAGYKAVAEVDPKDRK